MEAYGTSNSEDIVKSVTNVIDEVNSGIHPNEAFIKIVKSGKFTPEVTKRMIEAFNQSRAVKQLEEPIEKRAEHFEVADHQIIFGSVYSAVDTDHTKCASYVDETESHNFLAPKKQMVKVAHVEQVDNYYPVSDITKANQMLKKTAALKTALAQAEAEEASYNNNMITLIKVAAEQIKMVSHEPYDDFERRVQRAFGDSGNKLVNIIYKFANMKRTATRYEKQSTFMLPARSPYFEVSKVIDIAEKLSLAREKVASLQASNPANMELLRKEAAYSITDVVEKLQPEAPKYGPSITIRPEDKALQAEMRSIDLKTTISDLMANDPEIGSYPLPDVIKATNNVVSLAPNAMMNPATLRAAIHRTLADHSMSIDEALQLSQVESDMKSSKNTGIATEQKILGRSPYTGVV